MRIERTYDEALVESLMTLPELWSTCAEDGQEPERFKADCDADCWLLVEDDDLVIGLYNLHPHNSVTLEIHAQILPERRKQYSRQSSRAVLRWIYDNAPSQYQKVIAQVPDIYPNVIAFTEGAGFTREGVNRQSYRKNGELHDQHLLGITREEIGAVI